MPSHSKGSLSQKVGSALAKVSNSRAQSKEPSFKNPTYATRSRSAAKSKDGSKSILNRDSPQAFLLYIYLSRCVWERLKTVSKPFISHEIKLIIMLFSSCMTRNHAYRGYRTCECLGVYGPILSFGVVDINAASRLSRTGAVRRHQRCDINADRLRWLPMPT